MPERWYTVTYPQEALQQREGGFPSPEELMAAVKDFFGTTEVVDQPAMAVYRDVLPGDERGNPRLDVMFKLEAPKSEVDDLVVALADQFAAYLFGKLDIPPVSDARRVLFQGSRSQPMGYIGPFDPPGEPDEIHYPAP